MDITQLLSLPKVTTGQSGIYVIVSTCSDKLYVGSAVNLSRRRINHVNELRKGKHKNTHLQNSYIKHGEDTFQFKVLEFVDDVTKLIEREQYWIDYFKERLYNFNPIAGSRLGSKATEETKKKMSIASIGRKHTDEAKAKISATHKGKPKSAAHCQIMSEQRKGVPRDKEAVRKSNEGHYKPVIMCKIDSREEIKKFESIVAAIKYLDVSTSSSISQVLKGKRRQAYGYFWKYA